MLWQYLGIRKLQQVLMFRHYLVLVILMEHLKLQDLEVRLLILIQMMQEELGMRVLLVLIKPQVYLQV